MRRLARPFVIVLMLVALVLPTWVPTTLAGDDPPATECPEGLVYYAPDDICLLPENIPTESEPPAEEPPVEEPPAEEPPAEEPPAEEPPAEEPPVEEPPAEESPVEEPAVEMPAGQTLVGDGATAPMGTFTILPRACPYGTPRDFDLGTYRTFCTLVEDPNQPITVSREGGAEVFAHTAAGEQRVHEGAGAPLPSGTWEIIFHLTDTYYRVYQACGVTNADGSVPAEQPGLETVFDFIDVDVLPGQSLACESFLVYAEPFAGNTSGVDLDYFACPEFFREQANVADQCPAGVPAPITVEVGRRVDGASEAPTISVPVAAPTTETRIAADGSMPSGEWYLRFAQPPGAAQPSVLCTATSADGSVRWDANFYTPIDGTSAIVLLGPDHLLSCDVYLFAGTAQNSVLVAGLSCSSGVDPATAPDRDNRCVPFQGWDVTVSVDGGAPQTAETQRNGTVAFPSQPGTWRIDIAPDTRLEKSLAFVTCTRAIAALGTGMITEPIIEGDRAFTMDLDEGDGLLCTAYMRDTDLVVPTPVPTPTPETVAEATDPTPTPTPETAAPTPTTAPAPGGQTTNPPPSGQTTNPPPSDGTFGGGGTSSSPGTSTDTGTEEGEDTPSTLSIQHRVCAEPFGEATVDELIEICTPSPDPSSWVLNGVAIEASAGYVEFPPLSPALATVTNRTVSETDVSLVWCAVELPDEEPLATFDVAVDVATIELLIGRGAEVSCDWFVAPPPEEGASAFDRRTM